MGYALEVTNSVQGIFWRSFNKAGATAQAEQVFASRMPSTVHYTITFTDEYGDVSKMFIGEDVTKLDACSKRGLCDFDTGMCDCFSGYSGIRCDDQNAIAYSY